MPAHHATIAYRTQNTKQKDFLENDMESIKDYFLRMGLHDNRQGNKQPKSIIHQEKITRGIRANWKTDKQRKKWIKCK